MIAESPSNGLPMNSDTVVSLLTAYVCIRQLEQKLAEVTKERDELKIEIERIYREGIE